MRYFIILFVLIFSSYSNSECSTGDEILIPESVRPNVIKEAKLVSEFIPNGWKQVDVVVDDFNKDGISDAAISIVENDPNKIIKNLCNMGSQEFNSNPYGVLVVLGVSDGRYKLLATDFTLIPRLEDPVVEQPYGGINSKNGILSITVGFWASAGTWTSYSDTYKFRYQEECMKLIGQEYLSHHRASGDETKISTNYNTGKVITSTHIAETNKSTSGSHKLEKLNKSCLGYVQVSEQ